MIGSLGPHRESIAYTPRPGRHSSVVEQLFRKQQVLSSNLSVGSTSLFRSEPPFQTANLVATPATTL